ncbi:MAG: hypothetical protein EOP22_07140 [Hyphomicrobiales bacterium]|nr:MAG: hypothetical protein EOP22_07140 [Hyphomicrobiales bacterium]
MKLLAMALGCALVLTGCTSTRIDFGAMTADDLVQHPEYMTIMPSVPDGARVIGPVESLLCQKVKTAPAPDGDDALLALKRQAALAGGTALAEVSIKVVPTKSANCLSSASAGGIAYIKN